MTQSDYTHLTHYLWQSNDFANRCMCVLIWLCIMPQVSLDKQLLKLHTQRLDLLLMVGRGHFYFWTGRLAVHAESYIYILGAHCILAQLQASHFDSDDGNDKRWHTRAPGRWCLFRYKRRRQRGERCVPHLRQIQDQDPHGFGGRAKEARQSSDKPFWGWHRSCWRTVQPEENSLTSKPTGVLLTKIASNWSICLVLICWLHFQTRLSLLSFLCQAKEAQSCDWATLL